MDDRTAGTRELEGIAYRDGKWWTIELPELTAPAPDGGSPVIAIGQSSSLKGVDDAARDLAAVWLDVDPADLHVRVTIRLPDAVETLWAEAAARERRARDAAADAAQMRRDALRSLLDLGVSQADAARALSLSPQRVGQLVHEERAHSA